MLTALVRASAASTSLPAALAKLSFENQATVKSDMRFTTYEESCEYLEPESPARADWAWANRGSNPYAYRLLSNSSHPTCQKGTPTKGQDLPGSDLAQRVVPGDVQDPVSWCESSCCNTTACVAFVYAIAPGDFDGCKKGQRCCYLKNGVPRPHPNPVCTSGTVTKPVPNLEAPPLGMRSAPPLGGWTTGTLELRADGSFREVTILNQSPGDNPKWARQDGFGVALRVQPAAAGAAPSTGAFRTSPPEGVTGVPSLSFQGAYPVTRLTVGGEGALPSDTRLDAFGRVRFGNLTESARPAITLAATAPVGTASAAVLVTVPLAEQGLSRLGGATVISSAPAASPSACLSACNAAPACMAWTLAQGTCSLMSDVRPPLPADGAWSGTPVKVTTTKTASGGCCVVATKSAPGSMQGELAACVHACGPAAWGPLPAVFAAFSATGSLPGGALPDGDGVPVAAIAGAAVEPSAPNQEVTAVGAFAWHFPNRMHMGELIGNRYTSLFDSATDAADAAVEPSEVAATAQHYAAVHAALRPTGMPATLRDSVLNLMHHFRMPVWTSDDRVRSFEAYDCVNIDSVHNDGERSFPYLMAMPEFAESKMRAWGAGQLPDGMIQEQLGCGCTGAVPKMEDVGCGRIMSDVSSMFLAYALHLHRGGRPTIAKELWPQLAKAADWQIAQSATFGVPAKLQTTYDVLGLNAYDTCTYSSMFHILAMKACSALAAVNGDAAQGAKCDAAASVAQDALDARHWVEDGGPPPPGAPTGPGPWPMYRSYCDGGSASGCGPNPVNATMSDSAYAQVLAYTLGLGPLVNNVTRLQLHLRTTLQRHRTPYGMLAVVGRELPYPGTDRDNAVWLMGSPNWASLALYTGYAEPEDAWPTAQRALGWWRNDDTGAGGPSAPGTASRNAGGLADMWNVAGITGGINASHTGAPWITSHYGYIMTSWRMHAALVGQDVDLSAGTYSFLPKPGSGKQAGSWTVVLTGALAELVIETDSYGATATLSLVTGPPTGFPVTSVTIGGHNCIVSVPRLTLSTPVVCGPY